ncbi:FadR/GntR family transcriptional regulator [Bacteroides cellulosilyticus]|uniref:FadR/GntR family transcriptional regulator n=1 Tax=Bacteroides cellulosilyticus TaxID=246787 RepID=UPI00234C9949|nr:FadR/GntR family transcriptional regulator [Bacteroides cellulosilyticus]MDC7175998.1 FadR/GntR family transcriptional regulator [Bacteroides cellulosilyticus]MDC7181458.1 FadR/GntR family transcriptional regulator [Bacteroides cellulosilyticus]
MTNKTSIMIIQKKSLADMIAETLKQQITEGTYRAGDKLPTEPELMKTFGVGRSSVREAVKLLVNMGVVRVQQGSGTFVAVPSNNDDVNIKMSTADRTELDEVRKILDIAIVEKAVARRTEKDIERMRASLEKRKVNAEKGLLEECIEADLNFHIAIADAAHNRILANIYRSAATHLLSEFNRIYDGTDCFINSQTSHEKLLKHIIAGDLKNARKTTTIIVEEP